MNWSVPITAAAEKRFTAPSGSIIQIIEITIFLTLRRSHGSFLPESAALADEIIVKLSTNLFILCAA